MTTRTPWNKNIPGWSGLGIYSWLEDVAAEAIPPGGTYLEVGTFMGASLARIGTLRPDIKLITIDPWDDFPSQGYDGPAEYAAIQAQHGGLFMAFLHFMRTEAPGVLRRTSIVRGTVRTRHVAELVDVAFIDGAHDYESVLGDIDALRPIVRPGGILAGHDYSPDFPGVIQAVDQRLGLGELDVRETVWWCRP